MIFSYLFLLIYIELLSGWKEMIRSTTKDSEIPHQENFLRRFTICIWKQWKMVHATKLWKYEYKNWIFSCAWQWFANTFMQSVLINDNFHTVLGILFICINLFWIFPNAESFLCSPTLCMCVYVRMCVCVCVCVTNRVKV
jgi:hypothetical protein